MTSIYPGGTLGSVASLLAATLYNKQGHDPRTELWSIVMDVVHKFEMI